jgi:hypothetical protein
MRLKRIMNNINTIPGDQLKMICIGFPTGQYYNSIYLVNPKNANTTSTKKRIAISRPATNHGA